MFSLCDYCNYSEPGEEGGEPCRCARNATDGGTEKYVSYKCPSNSVLEPCNNFTSTKLWKRPILLLCGMEFSLCCCPNFQNNF